MKYSKIPITIQDQISKLKSRGLKFTNEERAAHYLSNITYYRLRAYTYPFQDNDDPDHPFTSKEITFEKVIDLYVFDRHLRLLLFDAIEKIEIAFRAQIINTFSLTHGSHWHIDKKLYSKVAYYHDHMATLTTEINRSSETFIDHYKNTYTDPPEPACWMSLEVSSIGLLSKIFRSIRNCAEKDTITRAFGLNDFSVFENWMQCMSILRNTCAHHGRVWNRRLLPIKLPTVHSQPFISKEAKKGIYPNKLYATLCCVEYLLRIISPNNPLKERLFKLLDTCPFEQEHEMGFPEKWRDDPFWK